MHVIGTAGHVDHGKSTLIEALTGTHPDRLKEEREREMTIDLGFAWMTLPNGEEIGIVDVPGHRDFIENMLAGVGGIDAALFVIAADEGVMPQTREHLAILDILQINSGVIALTKIDLVDDPEWLTLIEEDIRQAVRGTVLEEVPIFRVSARTRQGLLELQEALQACLADKPPRPDLGRPRLPVDRIFSISGFGTVVTGTLTDGQLKVGDELAILPQELHGRVRGLQTHKRKEEAAIPGSRTAVNISGVNVDQIQRGNVITHPGDYRATRRVDVRFRLLPDTSGPLQHNTETKLFIGAAEVVARVRLLGSEVLIPGQEGWLQLELSEPIVAVRGDRYILRRPSPGETLGGGIIIDPHPKGRHKRFDEDNLARLKALEQGTPAEILAQALQALGISTLRTAFIKSNLNESIAHQALEELFNERQIIVLEGSPHELPGPDSLVISAANWTMIAHRAIQEVENYHTSFPLRRGMPREELKSRLKPVIRIELSTRLYLAILRRLVIEGALEESGPLVFRPGHAIHFDIAQQRQIENLLKHFAASPYAPPSTKECQAEIGEELLNALLETGVLVQVAPEVVFRKEDYERMKADVRYMLQQQGTLTAASVRDHYNTSRKYALAFLEHLDAIGMTVREGDFRKLK